MGETRGAGGEAVVAQLLAFLRAPALHRPRYASGHQGLPDGVQVLRFAQGRFPSHVTPEISARERSELREAALAFIRLVCFGESATHYQLLCASPDAPRETLKEHYHLLMALIHPDRRDEMSEPWPRDCVQRVNLAYDVLGDDATRREYDEGLARLMTASSASRAFGRARSAPTHDAGAVPWQVRAMRPLVAFAAVAATLALFVLWGGDLSRDASLLREWGSRTRDTVAGNSRPRFLSSAVDTARVSGDAAEEKDSLEVPILTPLLRSLSIKATSNSAQPSGLDRLERVAPSEPASTSSEAIVSHAPDKTQAPAPASPVSQAELQSPRVALPAPAPPGFASEDIERVVVRLIGYYEAGNADMLMSLFDANDRGSVELAHVHTAYAEFFRATKQRTLKVSSINWRTSENVARAHGEALLQADYVGEASLERNVSLDMDLVLRGGELRIARLALFPNPP